MILFILRNFFNTNTTVVESFNAEAAKRLRATLAETLVKLGFDAAVMVTMAAELVEESKSIRETENIIRNLTANLKGQA